MVVLRGGAISYEQGTPVGPLRDWTRVPGVKVYRGTSLIRDPPPPGPQKVPRHRANVGSCGGGGSCERGTPVGCMERRCDRKVQTAFGTRVTPRVPLRGTHPCDGCVSMVATRVTHLHIAIRSIYPTVDRVES